MPFPCLKLLSPQEGQKQRYEISTDAILIGRGSDTDFQLLDQYVSRHHARIIKGDQGHLIEDLKSTHGTFVNDKRIEQQGLQEGDQIRLGRLELVFTTGGFDTIPSISSTADDLQKSLVQLSSVFASPESSQYSDLKKINFILDFKYQWGERFSSDETFGQILRSVLEISGAERGAVFVRQDDAFKYVMGLNGKGQVLSQSEMSPSQTLLKEVAGTGEPVFMTKGIEGELAQQESILEMELRAVACLPLKGISGESDQMELLGMLYLDSTKTMHTLSGLDQKILVTLAGDAGNVFEKLGMIRGAEERKRFEQEMAVAHETQKSLLPQSTPQFGNFSIEAFCKPTRHVGGDFYDFLELKPDQLLGVLADVSGKGVPAALLSSLFQGALDMECRNGAPVEKVLNQTNRFPYERSPTNGFVTLFFFSLNSDGTGEFAGAGHNPAYLFHAASGEIEELRSQGMILGAFESSTYESSPLELNPGDVLVVYSDGVTEAANHEGEMFGEERLLKIIKSHALAGAKVLKEKILEGIDQFTEGMSQTDDITFLLIEAKRA
ncbi:SpoIIE family protein phosphatase [Acidobacteria bacterium AH-259-D05]|nr:SpoIIE family protein phosphatase [Acidobacteria bacterium AH-259-D05]